MVSSIRGAIKTIQSVAKNAIRCSCANHALNLAISKSSTVQSIRNSVGLVKEIVSFFNMSAKRNFVLKSVLNGKPHLKSLCETRWTDRHDSIAIFKSSMSDIIEALTNISEWNELVSSSKLSKAKTLLTAMCTCEFIISINALSNILCVTAPISRILQGIDKDVLAAFECIQNAVTILENMRTNCDTVFKQIFEESCSLMKNFEIEVNTPRLSKRQTQRSNHPSETTEDFYRVSLFIPLVENVLEDLKLQFLSKQNQTVTILSQLIPKFIVDVNDENIDSIVSIMKNGYRFDDDLLELLEESQLKSEIQLWKEKWKTIKNEGGDVIKYALTAIDQCNGILVVLKREFRRLLR
ncbi:unnamed protein product [Macrosiphum euphorbiae]|nr:unnamed protein product [Macrosiphum euphorbiae]